QTGRAHHTSREIYRLVPGITEAQFPVPCFEVITKFSHLALKAGIKQHIMLSSGRESVTLFQGTICHARRHRNSGIRCAGRQGRVGNGERVKWVCKWHADAHWAKPTS